MTPEESEPGAARDGWLTASDAPAAGARVEMRRRGDGGMDVRSSDAPDRVLTFRDDEWRAWLDGVSRHEFDHLGQD